MPNWCNNNINIYGDEGTISTITSVLKGLKSDDYVFQSLIGIPSHMSEADYKQKWYDTNIEWFGTKWDISADEHAFTFGKDEYKTKIKFNIVYEFKVLKYFKLKVFIPLFLDFNICTGEISFFCETAWSPPIQFLENLCKMYKINAHIFYSEGGIGFAGQTDFIWTDGELDINDQEYGYLEGLYILSEDEFWSEVDYQADCILDEDQSLEDFLGIFPFVSEEHKEKLTTIYNETIKSKDEELEVE